MVGTPKGLEIHESLGDTCKYEFAENIGGQRGRGTFQRDYFSMSYDIGDQVGLEETVKIINKNGYRRSGKSFGEMEVPELLVSADFAE